MRQINATFGYNLLEETRLTEDRTMAYYWTLPEVITNAIQKCEDHKTIETMITLPTTSFEGNFGWNWSKCGSMFKSVALNLFNSRSAFLSQKLYAQIKAENLHNAPSLPLDSIQEKMLEKAKKFLFRNLQVAITQEIIIADMGTGILGKAKDGKIFISPEAFDQGTKMLAGTLWEEYLHLTHSFEDCSREFQNYLLNKCMSLAELTQGEPL